MVILFFRKVHGAGNDFILVTDPSAVPPQGWSKVAEELCARRTGIGADGLIVGSVLDIDKATFEVRCFNADGSIATMCGNALRCAAACAAEDHGFSQMSLLMAGVKHEASIQSDAVWVTAEVGAVDLRCVEFMFENRFFEFDSVHTGTEHVVAIVEDVDNIDVERCGRFIRYHRNLAPLGTNVNFVQRVDGQSLKIRTYERGVEAETLSCGSGAAAAAVIAIKQGLVAKAQVTVHNRSGTPLMIRPHSRRKETLWIGGPVTKVYQGEMAGLRCLSMVG